MIAERKHFPHQSVQLYPHIKVVYSPPILTRPSDAQLSQQIWFYTVRADTLLLSRSSWKGDHPG